jgi:hypothetical protein
MVSDACGLWRVGMLRVSPVEECQGVYSMPRHGTAASSLVTLYIGYGVISV